MLIYIARRVVLGLSVLLATAIATFTLFFAGPADPARALCGDDRCTPARLETIRTSMGLDKPVTEQFVIYFKGLFVGRDITEAGNTTHCSAPCLGYSFKNRREVKAEIFQRFPTTVTLALMTMSVFLTVGVTAGVYAARKRGTRADRIIVGFSQFFGAIPYYVVALLFALYFTVLYQILPRAEPLSAGIGPWLLGMVAPALILGLTTATGYVRYARAQMVDSLAQDYVRTARSKGISQQKVVFKHALRAALTPVVTILGIDMAFLLSGTLVTERIFSIDGVGRLAISSLRANDLPTIMGTVLVTATLVVVMNLLVDIAYSFLDPRVRLS